MFFAARDIKEVDEFLITYFMIVTNLNDFTTDSKEFSEAFTGFMEKQFKQNLCNKVLVIKIILLETTLLIKESNFGF